MEQWLRFGGGADYEYIVLGAGPAGLQMGHHLAHAGRSYLILEAGAGLGPYFRTVHHRRTLFLVHQELTGADDLEVNLRLHVRANTRVVRVEKGRHFCLRDAHGDTFTCRRLIVATGFDVSVFAPECRPQLGIRNRLPAQTAEWESVNVPGLYFAGSLTEVDETASGFRHDVRTLHRMLEQKYHGRDWPVRFVEPTPDGLVEAVLARLNGSSALWQQSGFLHDVIVVSDDWDHAAYYEELPLAYVHESLLGQHRHYYTVALELGKIHGNPFSIVRHLTPERADESVFLHPVIRRWRGSELLAEQHLLEELYGEWMKAAVHDAPLRAFFADQLLTGDFAEEETAERLLLAG